MLGAVRQRLFKSGANFGGIRVLSSGARQYIYFEMDATAVDAAEPDLVVWIVSRESQISDSAGWERLGSVCTPEKLLDLYENKAAGCGAKGFQMNIDAADEQGCRQVFLRVSAE